MYKGWAFLANILQSKVCHSCCHPSVALLQFILVLEYFILVLGGLVRVYVVRVWSQETSDKEQEVSI